MAAVKDLLHQDGLGNAPLYRPTDERAACGTGFVTRVSGVPSHDIVEKAVQAVINLTHRGAVSADGRTGDGAGILTQIPRKLFAREAARLGSPRVAAANIAVAMVFLPGKDTEGRGYALQAVEQGIAAQGLTLLGWRRVPVDESALGDKALSTQPDIRQALVVRPEGLSDTDYARAIYLARRRAEKAVAERRIDGFYIPSFSHKTIVYKGLFVAPQLPRYYRDLQDPDYETALAVFHQRYSTNTFPNWFLAQPFRFLGHNGEINTLQGNRNWLKAREAGLHSPVWDRKEAALLPPITDSTVSDSASLDHVLDLLVHSGRDALHAMMMLIPEAWENMPNMEPSWRAFYEYHAALMEPWDGPAAIAFSDGTVVAATLDRNGLRPARYHVTGDGLVVMASEVGVLEDIPEDQIVEKGRLGPGQMIAVDVAEKRLLRNQEIKDRVAHRQPYEEWLSRHMARLDAASFEPNGRGALDGEPALIQKQRAFGYTAEEPLMVLKPMVLEGKDATFSMGDDTPLAVFSQIRPPLYNYFKQKFAQVTNPPIDPLREQIVMSLNTYLGARGSFIEEKEESARLLALMEPILFDYELEALRHVDRPHFRLATLPAVFPVSAGPAGLREALEDLCRQAESAIDDGYSILVLSDRPVDAAHAPIPMLLAVGGVHHNLIRRGKRMRASLVLETGDPRELHHFAALIGYGASAINPYLALDTIRELFEKGELKEVDDEQYALRKARATISKGVLKVMSKMGISTMTSYHGAQIFEAIGLSREVIDRCFAETPSQVGGIGFEQIAEDALARHAKAFSEPVTPKSRLDDVGFIRYRKVGEYHANNPIAVRALHGAVRSGNYADYKIYADMVNSRPPTALRDVLRFKRLRAPIPIGEVEPIESIWKRFATGAMSLGALGPEAHETLAMAMNFIGGISDTGEGGEDPRRYRNLFNGYSANSRGKQVASGRFGVTPEYLAMAEDLEIKMAQGSKPGEGGQLPGHKVVEYVAYIRHTQPGITLISPAPHHDIYSIEDLAQLIYDLKVANPRAHVTVKLVAEAGVGTIAAGVAKGYADKVHISGHDGGTGASPLSSIKNAGVPWELGVAETQQVLVMNDLRGRVKIRTDGGFHTGRDVIVAAMLGADNYGFGTISLIAMGCEMARQCHLNSCPVGIATQREDLRAKFNGSVETLVHYFTFVATEVREVLANLGYRSLEEVIGHPEYLEPKEMPEESRARFVDPRPLLIAPDPTFTRSIRGMQERNDRPGAPFDDRVLEDGVRDAVETATPIHRTYSIRNTDRTVGARVSGAIAYKYGDKGLPEGTVQLDFKGTAGQSFGAFLVNGVRLTLTGEANDYVGKGMGGGELVLRPHPEAAFVSHENCIMGNTCLYGATGGRFFAAGRAGERFAVRNSGCQAVVEGVGDHGCEYMTNGMVVILGEVGRNFGAGMSGGVAFVLDEKKQLPRLYNAELLSLDPLTDPDDEAHVLELIRRHTELTGSKRGGDVLARWDHYRPLFVKAIPSQLKNKGMSLADVLKKVEGAAVVATR
ncbi:MAG: glutamate synthase large subunit [Chloroflexi bacterium]|nr:glutamate synthase large subunit [Chloroflexota bacterium]